jgi:hypothetical protein
MGGGADLDEAIAQRLLLPHPGPVAISDLVRDAQSMSTRVQHAQSVALDRADV